MTTWKTHTARHWDRVWRRRSGMAKVQNGSKWTATLSARVWSAWPGNTGKIREADPYCRYRTVVEPSWHITGTENYTEFISDLDSTLGKKSKIIIVSVSVFTSLTGNNIFKVAGKFVNISLSQNPNYRIKILVQILVTHTQYDFLILSIINNNLN